MFVIGLLFQSCMSRGHSWTTQIPCVKWNTHVTSTLSLHTQATTSLNEITNPRSYNCLKPGTTLVSYSNALVCLWRWKSHQLLWPRVHHYNYPMITRYNLSALWQSVWVQRRWATSSAFSHYKSPSKSFTNHHVCDWMGWRYTTKRKMEHILFCFTCNYNHSYINL